MRKVKTRDKRNTRKPLHFNKPRRNNNSLFNKRPKHLSLRNLPKRNKKFGLKDKILLTRESKFNSLHNNQRWKLLKMNKSFQILMPKSDKPKKPWIIFLRREMKPRKLLMPKRSFMLNLSAASKRLIKNSRPLKKQLRAKSKSRPNKRRKFVKLSSRRLLLKKT